MTKQRRARRARPAAVRQRRGARRVTARHSLPTAASPGIPPTPVPGATPERASAAPDKKPTYLEAVATYEQGVAALQRREFSVAAQRFREVLERYPEERELHERARLYLRVCERQLEPREPAGPRTPEERVFAATLALNAGREDEAAEHLTQVLTEDPAHGTAHYMLAIVHARKGDAAQALSHLARAVELDPDHRALARREADFDGLRQDPAFQALVEPPGDRAEARRTPRRRRTR